MARIAFPTTFVQQQILLQKIIAKHNADGTASVLNVYLTEQEVDLSDEQAAGAEAALNEKARDKFSKQKEEERELRDKDFNPAFKHLKQAAQFLKALHVKDTKALGAWGIQILHSGRVKLPTPNIERAEVFRKFYQKYKAVPAIDSPLAAFLTENEIDLDADNAKVQSANQHHKEFENLSKNMEAERELRDLHWVPVLKNMRGIGQFLAKMFTRDIRMPSFWGFVVVKAARTPKTQKSKVKPGGKLQLKGVIAGSVIRNLGDVDLLLFPGDKQKKPSVTLPAKGELKLNKGFSAITIVNTSLQHSGIISCLIQR